MQLGPWLALPIGAWQGKVALYVRSIVFIL